MAIVSGVCEQRWICNPAQTGFGFLIRRIQSKQKKSPQAGSGLFSEFVSDSSHRVEVNWIPAIAFEVFAEVQDEVVDRSCCRINVVSPDDLQDMFPAHDL